LSFESFKWTGSGDLAPMPRQGGKEKLTLVDSDDILPDDSSSSDVEMSVER